MGKTILVIDDEPMIVELVKRFLRHGGYNVITASNGSTGITQFETQNPDLIVLDIAMPEMSGIDVTRRIREIEAERQLPRTPIILLTAYARSFFLPAGSEAGIDSYLTKPITTDQLLEHVYRFLGQPQDTESPQQD